MVKSLKNLLLQNHWANCLETLYVAFSDKVLPNLQKMMTRVDPDICYGKVQFGPFAYKWEKGQFAFFENYFGLWYDSRYKMNA